MDNSKTIQGSSFSEANIKVFLNKVLEKKWLFLLSVITCLVLGYAFIKVSTPIYEVSTTMLVDLKGGTRKLGESQTLGGEIAPQRAEDIIYNEMAVLKSYKLVEKTLREMDIEVSYYAGTWYRTKEYYGYFPFEVDIINSSPQLYSKPFQVAFLSDSTYQLSIEESKFKVSNPVNKTTHEVKKELAFTGTYRFGEEVKHDYFHFVVKKPDYHVVIDEFDELDMTFKVHNYDSATNYYRGKLKVGLGDSQSSILQLKSEGEVVDKEVEFQKRLCANYIAEKKQQRGDISASKRQFIEKQLGQYKVSLTQAEQELENFRKEKGAINIQISIENKLNKLQTLETEKGQIELNVKSYNSVLQYLRDTSSVDKAPSLVGINDPLLNENLLELKHLSSEIAKEKYTAGRKSLTLERLIVEMNQSRKSLDENLRNLLKSAELNLEEKDKKIAELEADINTLPGIEKTQINLDRKITLLDNMTTYLSEELEKVGLAKSADIYNTRVLDESRMKGDSPVSPQKPMIMALAGLIGLILPLGFIVLTESFDDKVENLEQIEAYSTLPVIASIAHYEPKSKLFSSDSDHWQVEESFRDLCAGLQFQMPDPRKNVIGMISTIPGEGKTFCSINLAISLATGGKKTLLIDTDFRKPSFLKKKSSVAGRGLSNYLRGEVQFIDNIIHEHEELKYLHYIPTEVDDKNPQELLTNPRLEKMLDELRNHYDYIIFDAPAVGVVSDYLLISKFIDIHLYVLRRKVSQFSFIKDLEKLRSKGKMENTFLVLNDVVGKALKYGYTYKTNTDETPKKMVRKHLL